jgi:hypothetical protein
VSRDCCSYMLLHFFHSFILHYVHFDSLSLSPSLTHTHARSQHALQTLKTKVNGSHLLLVRSYLQCLHNEHFFLCILIIDDFIIRFRNCISIRVCVSAPTVRYNIKVSSEALRNFSNLYSRVNLSISDIQDIINLIILTNKIVQ